MQHVQELLGLDLQTHTPRRSALMIASQCVRARVLFCAESSVTVVMAQGHVPCVALLLSMGASATQRDAVFIFFLLHVCVCMCCACVSACACARICTHVYCDVLLRTQSGRTAEELAIDQEVCKACGDAVC